jgi:integrase
MEQALATLRARKVHQGASEATLEILELKAAHLLGFFGEQRPVDTLRLADTVAYQAHRRAKGVTDQTIELELRELRAALRWLARNELYDRDPAALWPEFRPRTPRRRWLTFAEYERLLMAVGGTTGYWRAQPTGPGRADRRKQYIVHEDALGQDWRDHLTVYCYVGLRLSELYRLEAAHLDGDHLRVPGTKTEGAARVVPLHPAALTVLSRRASERPSGPLFPVTSPSLDAQERAWLRALRSACARAQMPHASTNDLRRTFCSWAWQAGVPLELCVRWLGHHSARMAQEVYAQTSAEHGRDAIALLPARANLPRISHNADAIGAHSGNARQRKP